MIVAVLLGAVGALIGDPETLGVGGVMALSGIGWSILALRDDA